jgi:hypothetical protein
MEERGDSNLGFMVAQLNQDDIPRVIQLELDGGLNSLGRAGFERQLARPGSILLVAKDTEQVMLGSLSGWVIADEFQIGQCGRAGIGAAEGNRFKSSLARGSRCGESWGGKRPS